MGRFRRKRHGNTHGNRYRRVDRNTAHNFYTARVLTYCNGNTHRHKHIHAYHHVRSTAQQYAHIHLDTDTDPQPNRDNRTDRYTNSHSNGYYRTGSGEHSYAIFTSLSCANNTYTLSENRMYNPPPC